MIAIGLLFVRMLCDCFRPREQLEAELLVLRHQLNILRRRAPRRPRLSWADHALFIWLYRRCPRILNAITIVRPETVLRWHRMGFVAYWRWKSRSPGGRPRIAKEVRDLIRRMSLENPFWGATKIHGELLKLGIQVAQSTVSIYMVPRPDRPLQSWRPTSYRSPWQNGYVERLIGSVRRECTDHLIVLNAEHLRRILAKYATYYNDVRTHISLGKDAPCRRPIERFGNIVAYPILGGLHHQYARI